MSENKAQEGNLNRSRTIDLIRNRPGISRIEASGLLGLNRSTLTHIVNDLLADGFVREEKTGKAGERGGRIPIGLRIEEKLILGVEWQDSYIRFSLNSLSGETLKQDIIKLTENSVPHLISVLKKLIQDLETKFSAPIFGMGMGLPGRINPDQGVVLLSLPLVLSQKELARDLRESLGIPVLIENDANCFAWGEIMGRREFEGNLVCLLLQFHSNINRQTWDQEIGIGIVHHGSVYRGSSYAAGELRVSPVSDDLRDKFLDELNRDDSSATRASEEYITSLFKTINPVLSALDPHKVILGGDFFLHGIKLEGILKKTLPFSWSYSENGIWEVAQGGASFFIKTIFTLPGFKESSLLKGQWEVVLNQKKTLGVLNA
ncbi:ROK family transcriptional regulator [Oceanispirochaeta sp.]|uniref:ROK family transcriptional regulator n=1 Tax=Oceanispirochaeta sp. TaxID=2035350 RepID=UPI0026068551|nr:ROK family transcriptional regulator [Oceanispirochaeta sp.]MDA3956620.1 ROK family transcriptional regulator [Oceanispirochaeta sp.]